MLFFVDPIFVPEEAYGHGLGPSSPTRGSAQASESYSGLFGLKNGS
jgi:hypothetical protein